MQPVFSFSPKDKNIDANQVDGMVQETYNGRRKEVIPDEQKDPVENGCCGDYA